jgi:predicted ribosomally synthesized peptide with nif11-like leader
MSFEFRIQMSVQDCKNFFDLVNTDKDLQEKLNSASDADAVVEIAKESGFTVTISELLRANAESVIELSDDQLVDVAGGSWSGKGTGADVGIGFATVFAWK